MPIVNTTVVYHLISATYALARYTINILARNMVRSVEDHAVYAAGAGLGKLRQRKMEGCCTPEHCQNNGATDIESKRLDCQHRDRP